MKAYGGGGGQGIALLIPNLELRWWYVLNITLRLLYYRKRTPPSRFKRFWRREDHLTLPVSETRSVQPVASRYKDCATPAVINSLPLENVSLAIFLSLNTGLILQIRHNLPTNNPSYDPRQSRILLHTRLILV
jgi:hypothetical protein